MAIQMSTRGKKNMFTLFKLLKTIKHDDKTDNVWTDYNLRAGDCAIIIVSYKWTKVLNWTEPPETNGLSMYTAV